MDTVVWVRVSPLAHLLGGTWWSGLLCLNLVGLLGGHCSLGKSVRLSRAVGWDTVAWVKVPPLSCTVGWDTVAWVRVPPLAGL